MSNGNGAIPTWVGMGEAPAHSDPPKSPQKPERLSLEWKAKFPIVVCAHEWDVQKSKPALLYRKKTARVRIELRRDPKHGLGLHGYRDLEMGPELSDWSEIVENGDVAVFHLFKKKSNDGESEVTMGVSSAPSSGSVSTMGFQGADDFRFAPPKLQDGDWEVKLSVPLAQVALQLDKEKCVADFDLGNRKKSVALHFSSEEESRAFLTFVKNLKVAMRNMGKKAMKAEQSLTSADMPSMLPNQFLVEIISATDLKAVNGRTSDPYVVVKLGNAKIHSTDVIENNLNPIWTVKTKSLFIFTIDPEDYFSNDLVFEVRDKELLKRNKTLGKAVISNQKFMKAKGKRIELQLREDLQMGKDKDAQGILAIKCRRAGDADVDFMKTLKAGELLTRTNYNDFVTPNVGKQKWLPAQRKTREGLRLARPIQKDRGEQWFTSEEIELESLKTSEFWTDVGTGHLGALYVEVIGCDGLPNMDRGSFLPGDETDAFVTCVFEDAIVTTDVVKDCLSPRFMPWTQRAFKFHIEHTSSPLFIGVFDHDVGMDSMISHGDIGRLNIPLDKFVPNTTYNLTYSLFDTHEISNRNERGAIHLRIRIEWKGQRALFFSPLNPRDTKHTIHLNQKNYDLAHYTVKGQRDVDEYDLQTFFSLLNELTQYQNVYHDVVDAIKTVWLWRGHWEMTICWCCRLYIPLHSMIMLTCAIIVTEFPKYTVSVFFGSIAWFMLALLEHQRKRPSSWDQPPKYSSLLARFITNRARPVTIEKRENEDSDSAYVHSLEKRRDVNEAASEQFWEDYAEDMKVMEEMNNEKPLNTKKDRRSLTKNLKLDLFKKLLHPLQQLVYGICLKLRFVTNILTWDQMYISFWITTAAIICSIASIFIWEGVYLWTKRIILYTLCGPWNKLLDVFYYRKLDSLSDEEKEDLWREKRKKKRNHFLYKKAQKAKEDRLKEAAVKELMFGPHVVIIPDQFVPERYTSVPNIESSAFPSKPKSTPAMDVVHSSHLGQG